LVLLMPVGLWLFDADVDVDVDVVCLLFDEWDVGVAAIKYSVPTSSHFGSVLWLFSNALSAAVLLEKKRDSLLPSRTNCWSFHCQQCLPSVHMICMEILIVKRSFNKKV
jgi:hypothetical protein